MERSTEKRERKGVAVGDRKWRRRKMEKNMGLIALQIITFQVKVGIVLLELLSEKDL